MRFMYCSISLDSNVFSNLEHEQRDKAATDRQFMLSDVEQNKMYCDHWISAPEMKMHHLL